MNVDMLGTAAWGFREMELVKQLSCVKELGGRIHELGIANGSMDVPADADGNRLAMVKDLYQSFGIRLLCAATGNDFTLVEGDMVRRDVDKVKKVINICEGIGVKYLRVFAGFSPVEEVTGKRWERMIAALNEVAAYAKEWGVILGIETHGGVRFHTDGVGHFASTSTEDDTLGRMLEELDASIQFVYDPANLYAVGNENPEAIRSLLGGRICYVHCKEFALTRYGHLQPAACGDTDMDWQKILCGLEDFEGPVLIEYERTYDVAKGCRKSADYLRKFIKGREE